MVKQILEKTALAKDDGHVNRFSLRQFLRLNSVTFNLLRKLRRANLGVEDIEVANVGLHFSSESLKAGCRRIASDFPKAGR